jgi:hypothetical protein
MLSVMNVLKNVNLLLINIHFGIIAPGAVKELEYDE